VTAKFLIVISMANALEDLASVILAGRATFATNVSWVDRGSMRLEKDLRSIFRDIENVRVIYLLLNLIYIFLYG